MEEKGLKMTDVNDLFNFQMTSEFRRQLFEEENNLEGEAQVIVCTNAVASSRMAIRSAIEEEKFNLVRIFFQPQFLSHPIGFHQR